MVHVALRNTNCRRSEPFTRRRTRILDVGVAEDRHRTRPDARARLETRTETSVDGAVHDRPHDPAASQRTSLRKVVNSLSDPMRAIRPDVTCSMRPNMRRGGRARASRWSTNASSGDSWSATEPGVSSGRDSSLLRLYATRPTIRAAALPLDVIVLAQSVEERPTRTQTILIFVYSMTSSSAGAALSHRDGAGHAEREVRRAVVRDRTGLRERVLEGRPRARQRRIVTRRVGRRAELVVRVPVGPAHDAVTGARPHPAHRVTDVDREIGGREPERPAAADHDGVHGGTGVGGRGRGAGAGRGGGRRRYRGGLDAPEEPVRPAVGAGGEVQRVRRPGRAAVAERQGPQPVALERLAGRARHCTADLPAAVRLLMIRVDQPVAEVAHQQIATEV